MELIEFNGNTDFLDVQYNEDWDLNVMLKEFTLDIDVRFTTFKQLLDWKI